MKSKLISLSMLSIAAVFWLIPVHVTGEEELKTNLRDNAFFADLVVEGSVRSVREGNFEYFIGIAEQPRLNILTVEIDTLWAGYYSSDIIEVVVPGLAGYPARVAVDDHMLLFLSYDGKRLHRYFACQHTVLFVDEGEVFLSDRRTLIAIDGFWEFLAAITSARNIENLTKASDAVVKGRILESDSMPVRIERCYKGSLEAGTIIQIVLRQDMDISVAEHIWRFYIKSNPQKGNAYLLFLKREGDAYYPFAGSNSMIAVSGEVLFINNRTIQASYAEIEEHIMKELENE